MTANAVLDAQGNVTTPPTYLAGFVMLLRISDPSDGLSGSAEQWTRSKIAKYIKDNGTPGTMGGIPYYEIANVRLFRAADVLSFCAANNLPGHEWAGGNSF